MGIDLSSSLRKAMVEIRFRLKNSIVYVLEVGVTNEELKELIENIKIEVQFDNRSGNKVTEYKLPPEANNDEVVDALLANFEHYANASVSEGVLILEHPISDE